MRTEMHSLIRGFYFLMGDGRKKAAFYFMATLIALGAIGGQASAQGGSKGHPWPSEYMTKTIHAMTDTDKAGEYWIFQGDQYIRYSMTDYRILSGPVKIADAWPGLVGTEFANGIDAITRTSTSGEYWLFRGDQYIRYSVNDKSIHIGPSKIADGWDGLAGTAYANGIDAIVHTNTGGEYWMFKGGEYIRYSTNDEVIHFRKPIGEGWPGLKGTHYVDGIDAISPTKMAHSNEYWMFRDGSFARYSNTNESILSDDAIVDRLKGLDHFLMSKCVGP